jgi:hypothetical protein
MVVSRYPLAEELLANGDVQLRVHRAPQAYTLCLVPPTKHTVSLVPGSARVQVGRNENMWRGKTRALSVDTIGVNACAR